MYESPIEKIVKDIQKADEDHLMFTVESSIGYAVDKEELIKALQYDRKQYEKGYEDGRKANRWIPLEEEMPEEGKKVLVCFYSSAGYKVRVTARLDYNYWMEVGRTSDRIMWMPLPELPREVVENERFD